jgi:hypothetical protein
VRLRLAPVADERVSLLCGGWSARRPCGASARHRRVDVSVWIGARSHFPSAGRSVVTRWCTRLLSNVSPRRKHPCSLILISRDKGGSRPAFECRSRAHRARCPAAAQRATTSRQDMKRSGPRPPELPPTAGALARSQSASSPAGPAPAHGVGPPPVSLPTAARVVESPATSAASPTEAQTPVRSTPDASSTATPVAPRAVSSHAPGRRAGGACQMHCCSLRPSRIGATETGWRSPYSALRSPSRPTRGSR